MLAVEIYSATSRPALLTVPGLGGARYAAVIGAWSEAPVQFDAKG
jgi:hypothetical protein